MKVSKGKDGAFMSALGVHSTGAVIDFDTSQAQSKTPVASDELQEQVTYVLVHGA